MKHLLTLVCLIAFCCSAVAQTFQQEADSLEQLLSDDMSCTERVDLLNDLSYAYRRLNPDKILEFAKLALKEAKQCEYINGQAIANKNLGIWHFKILSTPDSALKYNVRAIELAEQSGDYYTMAACNNNIGIGYRRKKKLYTSIQYFLQGVEIFDIHFDEDLRLKALLLANIGDAYYFLGQYDKGLEYIKRSFDLSEKNGYASIQSIFTEDYGKTLIKLNRYDEARQILMDGLAINDQLEDLPSKALTLAVLSELEIKLGNYKAARKFADESLSISTNSPDTDAQAYANISMAEIELHFNNYPKVLEYCNKVIDLAQKNENLNLEQQARFILSKNYEQQGDYQKALTVFQKYNVTNEAILNEEKLMVTDELSGKYLLSKMEEDLASLNKEKKLREKYLYGIAALFVISILGIIYILFLLWKNRRINKIINEKNAELKKYIDYNLQLENFAYIASHDMKTPLRTIVSFSQLLKANTKGKIDEKSNQYLDYIIDGTKEMSMLLNDLLDYSRVNSGELSLENLSIKALVENVITRNQTYIEEKNAVINIDIPDKVIKGDETKLRQIFQNLILNGVKFHKPDESPIVNITSKLQNKKITFSVSDNGIGIEPIYYNQVFMIFKRLNKKSKYQGSGIGLAICKKAVEMHGGKIWLESEVGKGTTFHFTIPYAS